MIFLSYQTQFSTDTSGVRDNNIASIKPRNGYIVDRDAIGRRRQLQRKRLQSGRPGVEKGGNYAMETNCRSQIRVDFHESGQGRTCQIVFDCHQRYGF